MFFSLFVRLIGVGILVYIIVVYIGFFLFFSVRGRKYLNCGECFEWF